MYELPEMKRVKECIIGEGVIKNSEPPLWIYEEEEAKIA